MDFSKLIRDKDKVHACITELEDGSLVAKREVKFYLPSRFNERGLASVGVETYIVGIAGIVVDELYYGVLEICAMLRITPSSTVKVHIDDEEYYEFTFEAGSVITPSTMLVKTDTLVYRIYDEIISKGKVPWYLDYADNGRLFDTSKYHAGANIGENHEVTELIISMSARDPKDRHKYYRTSVKTQADLLKIKPVWVGMRSVPYAATNTTNKIAGSYFDTGVKSALVSPTERTERIEDILRR